MKNQIENAISTLLDNEITVFLLKKITFDILEGIHKMPKYRVFCILALVVLIHKLVLKVNEFLLIGLPGFWNDIYLLCVLRKVT